MKKNTGTKWLLTLLAFSASLAVYGILSKKSTYLVSFNSKKSDVGSIKSKYTDLKASFWDFYPELVIASDGTEVDKETSLGDTAGHHYSLSSLVGTTPKLIFRYSVRDCDVCVDSVFHILNEYKKKGLKDIILITDSYSERDFYLKAQFANAPYPLYNIQYTGLKLPIENQNLPFLFVLTPSFHVTKIFTPFKEISSQTRSYVELVMKTQQKEKQRI